PGGWKRGARSLPGAGSGGAGRGGGWRRSRALLLGLGVLDEIAGHRAALVEPAAGCILHRLCADQPDAIGPGAHLLDARAGYERGAIPLRPRPLIVVCVDCVGDHPVLGALELFGGDAVLDDVGEHYVDRPFELRQAYFGLGRCVYAQARIVDSGAVVVCARVDRDGLVHHQHLIETAVLAAAENVRQHIERFALARPRARARGNQIIAAETGLSDTRVGERDRAGSLLHRLLRAHTRLDFGDARDLALGFLRERTRALGRHITGYDDDRVIGRVKAPVEIQSSLAVELLDFLSPADHRPAVGMVEIERSVHLLAEPRGGIVADAH